MSGRRGLGTGNGGSWVDLKPAGKVGGAGRQGRPAVEQRPAVGPGSFVAGRSNTRAFVEAYGPTSRGLDLAYVSSRRDSTEFCRPTESPTDAGGYIRGFGLEDNSAEQLARPVRR